MTVDQLGYALALMLVLPLGDMLRRRGLLVILAAALGWLASAHSPGAILAAAAAVGVTSVQAQILVPFAADLAGDAQRGRVVGTVMAGLLLGILLARTVAGGLAALGGWRSVYLVAAALMLVQAGMFAVWLPRTLRLPRCGIGRCWGRC